MVPNQLQEQVLSRLKSSEQLSNPHTWKCACPFHPGDQKSLLVQFHFESVFCMVCNFGAPIESFLHHLEALPQVPRPPVLKNNPHLLPNDSYSHLWNEEVSAKIYRHIFIGKVKELTKAVEQLQRLIGKIKPDPQ